MYASHDKIKAVGEQEGGGTLLKSFTFSFDVTIINNHNVRKHFSCSQKRKGGCGWVGGRREGFCSQIGLVRKLSRNNL